MSPKEDLPRTVCKECSKNLDFINTFRVTVENAQKTILSLLTQFASTAKELDVLQEAANPADNLHGGSFEEGSFVSFLDESGEPSEASFFSEDAGLADPLDEHIKSEKPCEEETTISLSSKNFAGNESSQRFLPTDGVLEFVEVDSVDETYSPSVTSDESSDSEGGSADDVKQGRFPQIKWRLYMEILYSCFFLFLRR